MPEKLKIYNSQTLQSYTNTRLGEIKLGEKFEVLSINNNEDWIESLQKDQSKFVLLGLPEDIGVRANLGRAGASSAWEVALSAICNLQSNDFIKDKPILVLGHIDFSDLMEAAKQTTDVNTLRALTEKVDERVYPIIKGIVKSGKTPIIIGGGHNNAYPIIKGTAEGLFESNKVSKASINCINCDAHTDLRPTEGRHSGNGFSYAIQDGCLDSYYIVGPHQSYLTQSMLELFNANGSISYTTFEDFAIANKTSFQQVIEKAAIHTITNYCGIELDMDCIENLPSSAQTASGISANMARQFTSYVAANSRPAYLHITEAAPSLGNLEQAFVTGKLIAVMVADFIKAVK